MAMITHLCNIQESDSDGGDPFDKMVGGDTSRTSANGSSAKKERDSSPILDSDDEDDFVSKPEPSKKPAAKKKPASKAADSDSDFDFKDDGDDDDFVVSKPKQG